MRAWLLERPGVLPHARLRLGERPLPEPGPGEVRLVVRACGVCHTDLHTVEGELSPSLQPITPGHQVIGIVDAVGPGVTGIRLGERRGVFWLHRACGRCDACRRGDENLCPDAAFTGLDAHGGYAEAMVAPAAYTVPIPAGFSDAEAAPLLCAGVIGYRALRLSELKPGECLALFGFGASAHLVLQVARHWGCQVIVYTRGESRRRLARELGAVWAGGAEILSDAATGRPSPAPPAQPSAPPGRSSLPPVADRAIIFAPAGELVPLALRAVRPGGTVAINAVHMSDIPSFPYRLLHGERTLRSVAHVTRADAEEFLRLAATIPIRVRTQVYPFSAADRALADLKAGAVDGAAVLQVAG